MANMKMSAFARLLLSEINENTQIITLSGVPELGKPYGKNTRIKMEDFVEYLVTIVQEGADMVFVVDALPTTPTPNDDGVYIVRNSNGSISLFLIDNGIVKGLEGGFGGIQQGEDSEEDIDYISIKSTPGSVPKTIYLTPALLEHQGRIYPDKSILFDPLTREISSNAILNYDDIALMVLDQVNQQPNHFIVVDDASADPDIYFPVGTTDFQALYRYNGIDYILLSAPGASVSSTPTGLEAIDEGNGIGWRLKGRNPDNYGPIGKDAIDLGVSNSPSETKGATGYASTVGGGENNEAGIALSTVGGGGNNKASKVYATVGGGSNNKASEALSTVGGGGNNEANKDYATVGGGNLNKAGGYYATVGGGRYNEATRQSATVGGGEYNEASGFGSGVGGGLYNIAKSLGEFLTGLYATIKEGNATNWIGTDRIFGIGNGKSTSERSDAFNVYKNGVAELPSVTNALIDASGAKTIPTKEWVQEQVIEPNPSTPTLQEVIDESVTQIGQIGTVTGYFPQEVKVDIKAENISFRDYAGETQLTIGDNGLDLILEGRQGDYDDVLTVINDSGSKKIVWRPIPPTESHMPVITPVLPDGVLRVKKYGHLCNQDSHCLFKGFWVETVPDASYQGASITVTIKTEAGDTDFPIVLTGVPEVNAEYVKGADFEVNMHYDMYIWKPYGDLNKSCYTFIKRENYQV